MLYLFSWVWKWKISGSRFLNVFFFSYCMCYVIVKREEWLWSPANIKRANKDDEIYVVLKVHNCANCGFVLCSYTCTNYVTKMFLLFSSSKNYRVFCVVKAKKETKNIQQTAMQVFIIRLCKQQSSCENNNACKKFRLGQDSNPWSLE